MKRVSKCLLGAAVLLLLGEAVCGANLISYSTWPERRDRLMVMDENGGNPVQVYAMKNRDRPTGGMVSPAGLEETWILFNPGDGLYKVRPDGSGKTLVLCGTGTDRFGTPYVLNVQADVSWSPDGSEILVEAIEEDSPEAFIALLPANHTADETCASELVRIYDPPSPWTVNDGPAWNHDGLRIAFGEMNNETLEGYLAVIERQASGVWQVGDPIYYHPGSPDLPPDYWLDVSWRPQAGSSQLIYRMQDENGFWLGTFDLETGIWDWLRDGEDPVQMGFYSPPRWSSSGDEILYTDPEGDLVIWNLVNGSRRAVGSGTFADWQRDVVASPCEADSECDDGNPCSADMCNSGECVNFDEPDDTPCGSYAFCRSGGCFTAECGYLDLPICDDEDGCTVDGCVDYRCSFEFDSSIPGCSGGVPGDPCTTGADCLSGLCHPKKHECK